MYLNKKTIILGLLILSILIIMFSTNSLNSNKVIKKQDKPNNPLITSYSSNTDNLIYIKNDDTQEVFDLELPNPKDAPICTNLSYTN